MNKEEKRSYNKKYRENNKEKIQDIKSKYWDEINFNGLKSQVLERDNWECQDCGMSNEQHILVFNKILTCDHIDGNRDNNVLNNLITLCLRCHGKKDGKRAWSKIKCMVQEE